MSRKSLATGVDEFHGVMKITGYIQARAKGQEMILFWIVEFLLQGDRTPKGQEDPDPHPGSGRTVYFPSPFNSLHEFRYQG